MEEQSCLLLRKGSLWSLPSPSDPHLPEVLWQPLPGWVWPAPAAHPLCVSGSLCSMLTFGFIRAMVSSAVCLITQLCTLWLSILLSVISIWVIISWLLRVVLLETHLTLHCWVCAFPGPPFLASILVRIWLRLLFSCTCLPSVYDQSVPDPDPDVPYSQLPLSAGWASGARQDPPVDEVWTLRSSSPTSIHKEQMFAFSLCGFLT